MIKTSATPAISFRDRSSRPRCHPNRLPELFTPAADGDQLVGAPTGQTALLVEAVLLSSPNRSAGAQQVFDSKALQAGEAVALGARAVDVEVLERTAVLQ